jgi:hypothetical protein
MIIKLYNIVLIEFVIKLWIVYLRVKAVSSVW